jgi:PAS domain S-box-containing protein
MSTLIAKILLVGPDPAAATELSRCLAKIGLRLHTVARTGDEALALSNQEHFDVALVNLQLEGTPNGMATAQEMRRQQLPVIYIGHREDAEPLQSAGWGELCGHLLEPFTVTGLYVVISTALYHQQLLRKAFAAQSLVRTMLSQVRDGVIVTDMQGQVQSMSTAAEKVTGWTSIEAMGKPVEQICPLKDMNGRPLRQHPLRRATETNSVQRKGRFLLGDRNGHEHPVEGYASSLCDATDRITGVVGVFWDITERIRMEQTGERMRQAGKIVLTTDSSSTTRTELLALINRTTTAQEDERRRVARELHDDLGQRVALLQFEAERLYQAARVPEVRAGLKRFIEEAGRFSTDLRTLSHRLHPSILEELGLGAALRSLVTDYLRQGIDVTLWLGEISGRTSLDVRTSLYRITQEALRNARKHAPASLIHIQLLEENEQLELTIEDTGPGFDVNLTRATGGLGLLSMQERARLVGGSLLLKSHPDSGTTLTVRVPIRARS